MEHLIKWLDDHPEWEVRMRHDADRSATVLKFVGCGMFQDVCVFSPAPEEPAFWKHTLRRVSDEIEAATKTEVLNNESPTARPAGVSGR